MIEADMKAYQQLNNTNHPYPIKKTVDEMVAETAAAFPLSTAIIFEAEKLTYQELEAKANQFAHYLIKKGIKKNDVIGLALDRSIYLPVFILGVLKAGATFQPLDPSYPAQRIGYILQDGAAKMLVVSIQHQQEFNQSLPIVFLEDIVPLLESYSITTPEIERSSSEVIYILHTSGSTGKPKGVLIEHRNMVNLLTSMQKAPGLQPSDKLLSITSISFDIFYLELFLPLITGATMVMVSSPNSKDARAIIDCVKKEKITFLQSTPAFWNIITELSGNQPLKLKAITGGEPLSKELAKRLLGKVNELWNGYGPTETTVYASVKKVTENDEIITIGKPINNTRFYILDEQKQLVQPGEIGEIFIAGENVGLGYINLPIMTQERFTVDNIMGIAGQRMYQTGDLGRLLENAEVQCLGRIDQQIKINGFRIELGEIEHTITTVHPFVKQVVVHPFTKNNFTHLVAYYTCEAGAEILTSAAWKKLLKAYLPNYMVPDYYVLIDVFPLTPNGKIDKNNLKPPKNLRPTPAKENTLTATESTIKQIWANALGDDMAGLDDDFFEVGGHSLMAAQMMQQIERATGKRLPLATLFQNATIRALSAVVDNQKENKLYKSLVPINTGGTKTPLFVIHGSGLNILMFYPLAKYLDKDQPLYALQALGLDGAKIEGDTIEELAKRYNEELLEAITGDEFAILGYSLGGIIAFEMAKQLKAIGKKVKFLGIIDMHISNEDYHVSGTNRFFRKILRQPKKLFFIFTTLLKYPQKAFQYQLYISSFKLKKLFKKILPDNKKDISLEETINQHYDEAYLNYKLTPYEDKVFLFKAAERIYYIDDAKYLGWKHYCPNGLALYTVPGDHKTFLLPPNDKIFADQLQAILNNPSIIQND